MAAAIVGGLVAGAIALSVVFLERRFADKRDRLARADERLIEVVQSLLAKANVSFDTTDKARMERRYADNTMVSAIVAARAALRSVDPGMRESLNTRWNQMFVVTAVLNREDDSQFRRACIREYQRCIEAMKDDIEWWLESRTVRSAPPLRLLNSVVEYALSEGGRKDFILSTGPFEGDPTFGSISPEPEREPPRANRFSTGRIRIARRRG